MRDVYIDPVNYNANNGIFAISGDTYCIKDKLKEMGCKWIGEKRQWEIRGKYEELGQKLWKITETTHKNDHCNWHGWYSSHPSYLCPYNINKYHSEQLRRKFCEEDCKCDKFTCDLCSAACCKKAKLGNNPYCLLVTVCQEHGEKKFGENYD